jgi:4-aminobutyrate aminotransferase
MRSRHPAIGDVRGKGLMIGVEFVADADSRARAPRLRDAVVRSAFEHGLLLLSCGRNTIRLTPPLTVSAAEIDEALEIFELAVGEAERLA